MATAYALDMQKHVEQRKRDKGRDKEKEKLLLARITRNRKIFGGLPIIRGKRLAVQTIIDFLEAGNSQKDILDGYDWLDPEDIQACLLHQRQQATK